MTEKMTNSKALAYVLAMEVELPADVREKLENIKTSIDKKSANKSTKPTARQTENSKLVEVIYNTLQGADAMAVKDIIKTVPELNGLTSQRVTPMLRNSDKFTFTVVKGQTLYKVVE